MAKKISLGVESTTPPPPSPGYIELSYSWLELSAFILGFKCILLSDNLKNDLLIDPIHKWLELFHKWRQFK